MPASNHDRNKQSVSFANLASSPHCNLTALTLPLRPSRLAFAIYGWGWQTDVRGINFCNRSNLVGLDEV